ncbi:MAG TPA: type I-C CRISPR-associated protein Cas5c [Anaerolineales bacterium]|nr:type I-C CRISPR-associated protein Cas5c [Anaerolineales bacterium]HLO29911.1 type I-C CRISPR-associated protein Cas5c [Anaerolineales bacterium]
MKIRVSGDYALFTRPEMKVERVSYDIITPSAARGVIEAVYWKPAIRWVIDKIHVLKEIEFTNIRRNEVSEKASENKPYLVATEIRQQRAALVLKNVDYVIEAHFELTDKAGPDDTKEKHYNIVLRRLRKGQYFHAPCLGTREFGAKVELIEEGADIPHSPLGNLDLGWMLYDLDFSDSEDIKPQFFKASLKDGVMDLTDLEVRQ